MAVKRIKKELNDISKHPVDNCSVGPINDNLFEWQGVILSAYYSSPDPVDNQYAHFIKITFPKDYPFKAMQIQFIPKIDHPKVDKNGNIDSNHFKQWSPSLTITDVLKDINNILTDPNYLYVTMYKNYKDNIQSINSLDLIRQHPIDYFSNKNKTNQNWKNIAICFDEISLQNSNIHRYDARYDNKNEYNLIIFIPDLKTKMLIKHEIAKYSTVSIIGDIICEMVDPYFNGLIQLSYLSYSDAYGCSMSYNGKVKFYYKDYKSVEFGVSKYYEIGYEHDIDYNILHKVSLKDQLTVIGNHQQWPSKMFDDLMKILPTVLWKDRMESFWTVSAWNHDKLKSKR